jgi:hypothetical protein
LRRPFSFGTGAVYLARRDLGAEALLVGDGPDALEAAVRHHLVEHQAHDVPGRIGGGEAGP